MTIWNRARIFKIFVQLIRNPNRTELIFKGVDIVSADPDQEPLKAIEHLVLSDVGFKAMYDQNYVPTQPSMKMLQSCPPESFGEALYKHMRDNGLDFDLFPRYDSERPIKYLTTRIYQDHDLWHALFGYGTTVEDELAIQAFGVAQFQSPIALMLIAGGLLHLLGASPKRAIDAFRKVNEVYALGKRAPFLLSIRLHDLLPKPLADVRQICGIDLSIRSI
jgi:ubiquinone biosynthesis protein Coq4